MQIDGKRVFKAEYIELDENDIEIYIFKKTSADLVVLDGDTDLSGTAYIKAAHITDVMKALIELDTKIKQLADLTGHTL